tara:strand:+ start:2109 stop:2486 length:378 start_codon:yes stop_codon:yes gene_type:complete
MARKKGTTKASGKAKKTGLKNLSQAHGKEEKIQPTSLDQIWGDSGISKYKTLDKSEYETQIKDMNKSDLQTHATKVGLVPVDDMGLLRKRLMKEFEKHVASYKIPQKNKSSKLDSKALKILSEGK